MAMAMAACFAAPLPITDRTSALLSLRSPLLSQFSLPTKWVPIQASNSRLQQQARAAFQQSRRSILVLTGVAALGFPALAAEEGESSSSNAATANKPKKKTLVDTESWYSFRGDGFRMTIPPDYEDLVEFDDSGTSLYGERAKEKPFLARFASPDRKEVLSVVVRNGSQMKLSFLQTEDITEFGSLEEAAKVFVPAGSKIVAAAALKPTDSRVPRTYYLYEFLAKDDKRVVMSAAAAGGRELNWEEPLSYYSCPLLYDLGHYGLQMVFVFGAMAPNSRWKEVGSIMRSAAVNFALR